MLDRGLLLFNHGQYEQAAKAFESAALLARQMHSSSLGTKLRQIEPVVGWHKSDGDTDTLAVVFVRENSSVRVTINLDSDATESVALMANNPLFATANGGQVRQVEGRSGVLKYDQENRSGTLQFAQGHSLVTVTGRAVTEEELVSYAVRVPFSELLDSPRTNSEDSAPRRQTGL